MGEQVYSYHTFILPFSWSESGDKYQKFVGYFESNNYWECDDIENSNSLRTTERGLTQEEQVRLYNEYQYFTPYARKAIYGLDEKIVRNFSFMPQQIDSNAHYCIRKNHNDYDLNIKAIKLKVFNTGIALLVFECENTRYHNIEAAKDINDYGRRITLPFIPDNPDYSIAADCLTISISEKVAFTSDFRAFIKNKEKDISMNRIADIIKDKQHP